MTEVDGNFDNFDSLEETSDFHFIDPVSLPTGKDYHIFIAYTHVDSSFVLRLDKLLQNKGFKCCIHERDFIPGMLITENIVNHVKRSVKFVFMLSKTTRGNEWMQFEFDVAENLQIQDKGYKPIILKLDNCDLPDYMKRYTYLQTDGPVGKWIGLLLRAITDQTESNNHFLDFSINDIERFRQLVEKGSEQRHYVRIVVVGEQGAGKSCFVHRLLDKEIKDVVSTDCLDIQINVCGVDLDTEEWCFINEDNFSGTTRLGQNLKNVKPNTDSEEVLYRRKETSNTDTQTICKVTRADISDNRNSSAEGISRVENDLYWKESLSQVNDVKPFNRRLACVSFWDFAGHTEYYPTHQLFLSRTCIVLLVTDITKKIGDLSRKNLSGHFMDVLEQPMENVAGYIDYWSSCIHTFGYTCPGSELNPPIIVITTHTDAIQDNLDYAKSNYKEDLNNVVQRDEKRRHFRRHFFLSNTDERNYSKEIPSIRKYIYDISTQQENWGVEVPLKWIPLENELIKHRKMGKNILSFQSIKEISDESHRLIADEDEFKMFLKFHHDLGTVIYFDDVPDFIIINPNWFVKALRCIVSARDFISENLQLNWKEYEESGYIGMEMIHTIFQQKDPELAHNQEHIIRLMEKYDIVVEIPNVVRQKEREKQYCVPCIVKASAIEIMTNYFVGQEKTSILCFEYEFLPPMFFCHLVVYLLRTYNLSNESPSSSKKALYRGACVFDIDFTGREKLFLCKYQNTIQVQIWRWNSAITGSGQRIRIDIEDELNCIQRKYRLDSLKNYTLKVKCQFSESTSLEGMAELGPLVNTETNFYCNVHGCTHSTENIRRTWAFNRGAEEISKLTDENMNFLRIQKISTELMCDILYELLLHDNYLGLKPRNESDVTDLYSKIRGHKLRVPSNGWGGKLWPNESIHTKPGDDIERIRLTRNRLQHSSQFQMTDSEYNERIQQLTRLTERFEFLLNPRESYIARLNKIRTTELRDNDLAMCINVLMKEVPRFVAWLYRRRPNLSKKRNFWRRRWMWKIGLGVLGIILQPERTMFSWFID
ncbi:uncharacterized protein LOC127719588 [Mytilus californianus]|uniref:uncharacterized protein LOC127719588 n=1 Tax=Mytilus californianus TaxID=6549 RepID=UPI0022481C90|nr:uncharacterized protein LOC127719588 [Mytilus californianus]